MPYLHSNKHTETDIETCPNLDTDELEIDLFTLSVYSQDTAVIWPVFLVMCVLWSMCVYFCCTAQVADSRDGCRPVSRYSTTEVELTQSGLLCLLKEA